MLQYCPQVNSLPMVVGFGRAFLKRMIKLAKATKEYHYKVRLNRDFRSDLQ